MIRPLTKTLLTMTLLTAPAPADTTTPGIQPPGPNGQAPAVVRLPPVCAEAMFSCGFDYDPGSGTWKPRGTGGGH